MPPKWDQDSTPSEKLLSLFVLLLFNNRYYSLKELTGKGYLNSSKASVGRLLNQLERAKVGSLKKEKRGRESFYKLERPTRLPTITLNADGLHQLAICRDFLSNLLPEKMLAQMDTCLNQAVSYLPQSESMPPRISAGLGRGRIDYTRFQPIMNTLVHAIQERLVCAIEYKSIKSGTPKRSYFAPLRLIHHLGCIYAEGWTVSERTPTDLLHPDPWRLPVQRFLNCEKTELSSTNLPDLPPLLNDRMGIMTREAFEATLWFSPIVAPYISEREWSEGQTITTLEDGSIILKAKMASKRECMAWILSYADGVKVLEPDWLKKELEYTLLKMLELQRIEPKSLKDVNHKNGSS